jgi:phosphoserine phosphatase
MKKKIVLFDLEGTLFPGVGMRADGTPSVSTWALLAEKMGPAVNAVEYEHYLKWKRGEYASYLPWMEDTSALFKREGMTREFFDTTIKELEYFPGVKDVFDTLHASGFLTGVVTGGFYEHAVRTSNELGVRHVYASCRYFWDDEGKLSHWELEENGLTGKVRAAEKIAEHYGASLRDCSFVGDGDNDVYIAKAVGTSVAFNGFPELKKVTTYSIEQEKGKEDFCAILPHLLS